MKQYATSKEVHKTLKLEFDKSLKPLGYKRGKGFNASYYIKRNDNEYYIGFWVQLSQWGDDWSGNNFTINCDTNIKDISKPFREANLRLTKLIPKKHLEEAKIISRNIISSIPIPPENHWIYEEIKKEDGDDKYWTDSFNNTFIFDEESFKPGLDNWFNYFDEVDITNWAVFLSTIIPNLIKKIVDENIEDDW